MGDSNTKPKEVQISEFLTIYNLKMIYNKKRFKNPEKASYIDLIITNCPKSS